MERLNRRQKRRVKFEKKTQMSQIKPRNPATKEQILEKIRELEYQRIMIPKYPNPRFVSQRIALTTTIQVYYKKIELLKNAPKGKKPVLLTTPFNTVMPKEVKKK